MLNRQKISNYLLNFLFTEVLKHQKNISDQKQAIINNDNDHTSLMSTQRMYAQTRCRIISVGRLLNNLWIA